MAALQFDEGRVILNRRVRQKASIAEYLGRKTSVVIRVKYIACYLNKRVYLRLRTQLTKKKQFPENHYNSKLLYFQMFQMCQKVNVFVLIIKQYIYYFIHIYNSIYIHIHVDTHNVEKIKVYFITKIHYKIIFHKNFLRARNKKNNS